MIVTISPKRNISANINPNAVPQVAGVGVQGPAGEGVPVGSADRQTLVWDTTTLNYESSNSPKIIPALVNVETASSITPDIDHIDQYQINALATNATFNAPIGTPLNGQKLLFRIRDNGVVRTLTWNAIYRSIGIDLPVKTVINQIMYVGCIYNSLDSKWDVIAVTQ
jgi:hypothetical protein